jgi:two-component system sensor histidine kinase and response regulator WspE
VIRALIVEIGGEPYAFSLSRLERVMHLDKEDIMEVEGLQYLVRQEENIGLVPGWQVLGVEEGTRNREDYPVVVIGEERRGLYAISVDRILGERELVVQELDADLGKVPNISSGACMETGEPVLVIDVDDMVRSTEQILHAGNLQKTSTELHRSQYVKRVLVVDDSITVREVEVRLLQSAGYLVDDAVDGADAWNTVRKGDYDLVVTDIDMPRMTGIELTRRIRGDHSLAEIPIIVVSYKDRSTDREEAMEAGANLYVSKSSFQDEGLLKAVEELIKEERESA